MPVVSKKRSRVVDVEMYEELVRMVAALRRRVVTAERKQAVFERKLALFEKQLVTSAEVQRSVAKKKNTASPTIDLQKVLTPDGLVMVDGVPHLIECMRVLQPMFGDCTCTCGALGLREQKRS